MDTETSGCGSVGIVVRGVQELLVIILNWFWLLVLLHKKQFKLVWLLVLFLKNPNRTGFCPFYWFCSSFAPKACSNDEVTPYKLCVVVALRL